MFRAGGAGERPPRVRRVEVARGRAGYGFTLCGQAPCALSGVLRGSPADSVGLRAGDQVLAVNEINVRTASHEDVVKLIGRCPGALHLVVGEARPPAQACSSEDEAGPAEADGRPKPRLGPRALGINRAERVVAELQSGGILSMILASPGLRAGGPEPPGGPQPSPPEPAAAPPDPRRPGARLPPQEEAARVADEAAALGPGREGPEDAGLDAGILNVAMVVGYLGSIELPSAGGSPEADSLPAIRGCLRRLRAEQRVHALVALKVLHDRVQLCAGRAAVLAEYPAEKLAFSAVCPDDRRLFGLVTMQPAAAGPRAPEGEGGLRTSCHVFAVDPDLFQHRLHQGLARRFGLACTPDPDTGGCLEFPASALPVLQFVAVLYRDMGQLMEGVRARALAEGDADAPLRASTGSTSDSGVGNLSPEERGGRVLVVELGGARGPQPRAGPWNGAEGAPAPEAAARAEGPPGSARGCGPPPRRPGAGAQGQRWLPVHVLQERRGGPASDLDSCTDSTDGRSSVNCGTLPPPMSKIPADRYRLDGGRAPPLLGAPKRDWPRKALGAQPAFAPHRGARKTKEDRKGSRSGRGFGPALTAQRASARRSFSQSRRFSITRSLDDLESATVSDGELSGADLKDCASSHSLSSNASLPSVQSCRRLRERRVASWAVSFERLLQDPLGVRYFSDFLRKEFSEENILFWQACERFHHVPAHDQKELAHRAREIFSRFLGSKASTPVNIDSQAQLADHTLSAPHPDMFKEQQLQIFNLMKFDSYTRFLKSPLYQECILAEVEGRPLPDAQQVPGSPASKHSLGSDHSNTSTPKKLSGKSRSGRSLNEDPGEEDGERRRKGAFFSWSRTRSTGRSQKKKGPGDPAKDAPHANGGLGRRESQGSVSSAGSLDLAEAGRTPAPERDKAAPHCRVQLPDGSSCVVLLRAGLSVREVLAGLCERHGIHGAAADLFLVGGDKPLTLHQDSSVLQSRDLRLEKRALFRLDLVPINRSVGLKARPSKPVTEVLRPVAAKYGLHLSELVARLSGEQEPLDLGAPIASLDGQRVVLEEREPPRGRDKQRSAPCRPDASSARAHAAAGEERPLGKVSSVRVKGGHGKPGREPWPARREEPAARTGPQKHPKIDLDEAEEFFELISRAQSSRADDQRGLLRKEDLELPEFLRLPAGPPERAPDPGAGPASPATSPSPADSPPLRAPGSPAPREQEAGAAGVQTQEGGHEADLTLTGEGDIGSPHSTLLPSPLAPQDAARPPRPGTSGF